MAVVAMHKKFRLGLQLLGSVTFFEIYLIKVMIIKGGNRRHFYLPFWICSSFSSIFFHCPVFSCPSVSISFSLISFFFPFWRHFCPPFSPVSSFFAHFFCYCCICFHSYSFFFNLHSPSLFLSLSFTSSFLPVRSTLCWRSCEKLSCLRIEPVLTSWCTGARQRDNDVESSGTCWIRGSRSDKVIPCRGWVVSREPGHKLQFLCVAMPLATVRRIVSLNLTFVKYVFRRRKLKLIITLNAFEITFSY